MIIISQKTYCLQSLSGTSPAKSSKYEVVSSRRGDLHELRVNQGDKRSASASTDRHTAAGFNGRHFGYDTRGCAH